MKTTQYFYIFLFYPPLFTDKVDSFYQTLFKHVNFILRLDVLVVLFDLFD